MDSVSVHPYLVRTQPFESRTDFPPWREKDASRSENSDDLEKVILRDLLSEPKIVVVWLQSDKRKRMMLLIAQEFCLFKRSTFLIAYKIQNCL